jgi:CRISPR-associated protein Csx17
MKTNVVLQGCAPIPLAHYLKALGVLRLVSEQCDASATAAWRRDMLHLSSTLDENALVAFFLTEYQPTPVLAPWNGGSGFFPKDNREAIAAIEGEGAARLDSYRSGLAAARTAVAALGLKEKPDGETKTLLLQTCRNTLPDDALAWLDAVFVLGQDGPKYPPLLGTGGNDGRLEFTNNFMQRLTEIFDPKTGEPTAESEHWLRAALFAQPARGATAKAPIGQFFPGAAGGANGTSGFDAPATVNPWDFVLMIEGALLFAAASVKQLESASDGSLVYPFCVRQAGVGYASAASADEKDARCEMWMPLWSQPATLPELRAIFSEGRAQVGGRAARNGVDFARAAVTLGVDRGIAAFHRYGFQVRNGLAYFATPLERVTVRRNVRADLLADIDQWLDRLRQKAGPQANPAAPASVSRALNQLERNILDLCRDDSPDRLQAVLVGLGRAERALARSFKWTTGDNVRLRALHQLNPEWLQKAATDRAEFRLAAALAGNRARLGKETLWLRQHLEPLTMGANLEHSWVNWDATPSNDVVWHEGELADALNAIVARRMIRVQKSGARGWPDYSPRPARLADITEFIEGRTDDARLADLLWGLSLVDWEKVIRDERAARKESSERAETRAPSDAEERRAVPSSLYALLRLCLRRASKNETAIPLVPAIHRRAAQGQGAAASEIAVRRLRGSGYAPLVARVPVDGPLASRTAAASLFPISDRDFRLLERSILHQLEPTNS